MSVILIQSIFTQLRGHAHIAAVSGNYFQDLYSSQHIFDGVYQHIFQDFKKKISDEINIDLIREVSSEEIKEAFLFQSVHIRFWDKMALPEISINNFGMILVQPLFVKLRIFFDNGNLDQITIQTFV